MDPRIEFNACKDGFAIAMNTHISLMKVCFYCGIPCVGIALVLAYFEIYEGLALLLLPCIMIIFSLLVFVVIKYDTKVFLAGTKQKINFKVINKTLYKENKEVKLMSALKVYRYRKFLFIETSHAYFIVRSKDFKTGTYDDFLLWCKENNIKTFFGF